MPSYYSQHSQHCILADSLSRISISSMVLYVFIHFIVYSFFFFSTSLVVVVPLLVGRPRLYY